jgi:hypothetical protein
MSTVEHILQNELFSFSSECAMQAGVDYKSLYQLSWRGVFGSNIFAFKVCLILSLCAEYRP